MQQAFVDVGFSEPSTGSVRAVIGLSLGQAISTLIANTQQQDANKYPNVAEAYRQRYYLVEHTIRLFPHVRETLEILRQRGYQLGVVTGKSCAGLLRVLKMLELDDAFDVWRTADGSHSKPHPGMVLECMQELEIEPERTVVVGDAVCDMQMAAAAKVKALGVSFGVASGGELIQAGADGLVDDFSKLLVHFPPLQDQG